MQKQITELLALSDALPVLFVGSGLTRRYLNLPDWKGLLKKFSTKPFEYYNDKATRQCRDCPDLILPTAADYIEADFNERWYISDEFQESREQHAKEMEDGISPFKICIADFFQNESSSFQTQYKDEIALFKQIGNKNISCIITTNYDCFLEKCFGKDQFRTYIGQDDLLFSTTYEVGELYKIHGCCTKAESIVINSDDYNRFLKKSAYLSAKILTMFLERPIIFLGYGIGDSDIQHILDSVAECLEDYQLAQLSQRMIFVEWNMNKKRDDCISERMLTTQSGKTISMKNVLLTDYGQLYSAILHNKVRYDVKILRRLKSQLYELVKENKPTEKLYVATSIEDEKADIDFVVGIGVYGKFGRVGYRGIKSEELYLYVINRSDLEYDDTMILKEAIPVLYNGRSRLPVCKLIAHCTDVSCLNKKVRQSIKSKFSDFLTDGEKKKRRKGVFKMQGTIVDYYRLNGLSKTVAKIPLLNPSKINKDDLLDFIYRALDDDSTLLTVKENSHPCRSQFKRCISIWDWLSYYELAQENIRRMEAVAGE